MPKKSTSFSPWPLRLALELVFTYILTLLVASLFFLSNTTLHGIDQATRLLGAAIIAASVAMGFIYCRLKVTHAPLSSIGLARFSFRRAARYLLFYYLAVIGVYILATSLFVLYVVISGDAPAETSSTDTLGTAKIQWAHLLVAAVIAPIAEEIIFRGILFPSLTLRTGVIGAAVLSSLLFTVLHIAAGGIIGIIMIFGIAIFACFLYRKTGSIIPGIAFHSLHNLTVVILQSLV